MLFKIPFLSWTGKAALEIEIPDDTKELLRARAALKIAVESGADLSGAGLSGADLSGADLSSADLSGAGLIGADLRSAGLSGADLSGADLRSADLRSADLSGAGLSGADLSGADLRSADLRSADLRSAILSPHMVCPEVGAFTAFKKVYDRGNALIAVLTIPADARRVSSYIGRKCRAEFVICERFETVNGEPSSAAEACSRHNADFKYRVGERITPDRFDPDERVECSSGIHFYVTRKEAVEF
jgi:hypothetical protein